MTQDEIIEMARQAGVRDDENIFEFSQYKYLERFAKLVAAKEREWVGLTNDELTNLLYDTNLGQQSAVLQAIALLKEKNT